MGNKGSKHHAPGRRKSRPLSAAVCTSQQSQQSLPSAPGTFQRNTSRGHAPSGDNYKHGFALVYTEPQGLEGLLTRMALVFEVINDSKCPKSASQPRSGCHQQRKCYLSPRGYDITRRSPASCTVDSKHHTIPSLICTGRSQGKGPQGCRLQITIQGSSSTIAVKLTKAVHLHSTKLARPSQLRQNSHS
jgi:hypothetical protein